MSNSLIDQRVRELQAEFEAWHYRKQLKDEKQLASILKAWGF